MSESVNGVKLPKHEVCYQDMPRVTVASTTGDARCIWEHCFDCTMYRPPNSCTAVVGDINPRGWCKLFSRL